MKEFFRDGITNMDVGRFKVALINLLLVLLSCFVALIVAELALRYLNISPRDLHRLDPATGTGP